MYHANLIISRNDCREFVFEFLKNNLNFKVRANPDFLLLENETFGIDAARDFGEWVLGRPFSGEAKVSLIVAKSIGVEAQNALLKVLEEPPPDTYIFINLESLGGVLPTFLSRVQILDLPPKKSEDDSLAQNFLSSKIKEKFAIINSFSKKEDKNLAREFIKSLEEIAYQSNMKKGNLKNILTAKIFSSARGSSPKMLLEWLSCVLH